MHFSLDHWLSWRFEKHEGSRRLHKWDFSAFVVPTDALSLFADLSYTDQGLGGHELSQDYSVNWGPFPDGALDLSLTYRRFENRELYGKDLSDRILCLPKTTGSTSAGAVWQRLARLGVAPKAVLFSQRIDSLAAGGLIVADLWAGRRICTVDQLGDGFLEAVADGDRIVGRGDGTGSVESRG